MTRGEFINEIAKEMAVQCGGDEPECFRSEAIGTLEYFELGEGVFGDPAFAWDVDAAKVLAWEEMSYWEEDGVGKGPEATVPKCQ